MTTGYNRREFLKLSSAAGAGVLAGAHAGAQEPAAQTAAGPAPTGLFTAPPIDRVRIGFVGIGKRGTYLLRTLMSMENVEVRAVCDIIPDRVAQAQQWAADAGQAQPAGYSQGDKDFERMCAEQELDLVVNAAPWEWHVPICVAAMQNGKHTATEVPAAVTLEGCWQLVETAEKTQRHCVLLENCCYFRNVLMVLRMVRSGLLGDLLHCEAGYQHYRIANNVFDAQGNLLWCGQHEADRDGNLYPTHPVGPVGHWMNINRGDQFDYLVSMSGKSVGLNLCAAKAFGADHPLATRTYALGDINTTLIRTKNGLTVTLYHDTQAPRPYDLIYRVQGTNGLYMGTMDKIYVEGRSAPHEWQFVASYVGEYDHPLWRALEQRAIGHAHGGGDLIMLYRMIQCLRTGQPMDIDVYDAAAWSAIVDLSCQSVADRSRPKDFPDFTRGAWTSRPPLGIVEA